MVGRHDEAIALTHDFAERFPEQGRNHLEVVNRLVDAERFDEALQQLGLAEAHGAEPAMIADTRGVVSVGLGRLEDAVAAFEFAVDAKRRDAGTVGRTRLHLWPPRPAIRCAGLARGTRTPGTRPSVYRDWRSPLPRLGLGNAEAAIDEIRTAVEVGGRETISIQNDPFFSALRAHPQFEEVVANLDLPSL